MRVRSYSIKWPVIILLLLICSRRAFAQYNDSVHHYVFYSTTGVINKTNDGNSFVLNNTLRFGLSKKLVTLNFSNSYIYGEQQIRKTNNDFSSSLDFDVLKNVHKLYYWGLGTFDKSYSLKINHRYQVGAGLGYTFLKTPTADFVVSDGIINERSDVQKADSTNENYGTLRNSARIKYRWVIKDLLIVEGASFIQHSLSDKHDYILKSNNSASVRLRKWLNFTTTVNYNKLSRTQRETLLITFGLSVEKYF